MKRSQDSRSRLAASSLNFRVRGSRARSCSNVSLLADYTREFTGQSAQYSIYCIYSTECRVARHRLGPVNISPEKFENAA